MTQAIPIVERLWAKTTRTDSGCLEYTGPRDRGGYGRITNREAHPDTRGKSDLAHRVAWTLTYGPIPNGLLVLHHCDNPPCVNPEHLFIGTQADNIHDMMAKGREPHRIPPTHCKRGHPFTLENTYVYRGHRNCKTCSRAAWRRWSAK